MTSKNRKELKSYFVKNAIPTEGNFADLIDSQLNQTEDGVFKLAGEPLSVVAAAGEQKRVLRLYGSYPAPNPDWLISLNPAQDPANASTNRPGFGIADGAGNTRLFIDPTGKLGVGTNTPADKLTVRDGDIRIEGGYYRRLKIISDKYWAGIELVAREQGEAGNPHIDFTHGDLDAPNYGIRIHGTTNNTLRVESGDGTANLEVIGNALITGATNARKVAVNDGTNSGVGRGLWVWNFNDSNHVIYSASPGSKSPADKAAVAGFCNGGHRMRFRTYPGQGFLFENSNEEPVVDIASDTGDLWTRGALRSGNSDIYFTRTDHKHSGIGNTQGWAAIENASDYNSLMILGRQTPQGRIVKLWDYLEVNGNLTVTGNLLRIGEWTLESAGAILWIKRGGSTVARFSTNNDRFNVYKDLNGRGPYMYYNAQGNLNTYGGDGYAP